jgi:Arc/MetJ-type ribon-helix-helix transcriptional regulator
MNVMVPIMIPNEMHEWVETQIKSGRFESRHQYISKLIKNDQEETNINRILFFIKLALLQEEQNGQTLSVDEVIKKEIKKLAKQDFKL